MEQNPYESPKVPNSRKPSSVLRRSIGAVVILLLTPVAVAIAFGGSCAATFAILNTNIFGQNYGLAFLVGWSIFLIPPALVLVAMVWWFRVQLRSERASQSKQPPGNKSP